MSKSCVEMRKNASSTRIPHGGILALALQPGSQAPIALWVQQRGLCRHGAESARFGDRCSATSTVPSRRGASDRSIQGGALHRVVPTFRSSCPAASVYLERKGPLTMRRARSLVVPASVGAGVFCWSELEPSGDRVANSHPSRRSRHARSEAVEAPLSRGGRPSLTGTAARTGDN